jgi:hypothetical protein
VRELLSRTGDPTFERRYVYLHGRFNDTDSIVLTERDYATRYIDERDSIEKLKALFSTCSIVFVGFSTADLDLMDLLREVHSHRGPGLPTHFAVLPHPGGSLDNPSRHRLNDKFSIEPVFYDTSIPDHGGLPLLIRQLAEDVAKNTTVGAAPVAARDLVDRIALVDRLAVSRRVRRLIVERPDFWEFRIFPSVLADEVGRHEHLRQDIADDFVLPGEQLESEDAFRLIGARFRQISRAIENLPRMLPQVREALGAPGEPADVFARMEEIAVNKPAPGTLLEFTLQLGPLDADPVLREMRRVRRSLIRRRTQEADDEEQGDEERDLDDEDHDED